MYLCTLCTCAPYVLVHLMYLCTLCSCLLVHLMYLCTLCTCAPDVLVHLMHLSTCAPDVLVPGHATLQRTRRALLPFPGPHRVVLSRSWTEENNSAAVVTMTNYCPSPLHFYRFLRQKEESEEAAGILPSQGCNNFVRDDFFPIITIWTHLI